MVTKSPTGNSILLVDDDPTMIHQVARILAKVGDLRFASCGEDGLRLAREAPPDLVLLDAEMPGQSGFQVCETFKEDPMLADVPVIFVTSHCEPAFEVAGLEMGAADFIAKPFSSQLMLARVKTQLRVKHMADELRRTSTIDALTGIANRRRFDGSLEREWLRARRSGDALSLMMIDVDHFKLFNDRYGHPAGDECLRAIAQALAGAGLRPGDLVARYGGEEFVLLMPDTPREGVEHVAHRVLDAIEALNIAHATSPTARHVTVSLGIACYDEESACWRSPTGDSRFATDLKNANCAASDLVGAADKALYAAKRAGRAQARLLDIDNIDVPYLARDIAPARRARRVRPSSASA